MFNVGPEKMVVIFLLALVVLGPDKLPSAARQMGQYLSAFRRMTDGFRQELRDAIDLDGTTPDMGAKRSVQSHEAANDSQTPGDGPPSSFG